MNRKDRGCEGYGIYKDHYACFNCRKAFKQPNLLDLPKEARPAKGIERKIQCPQCKMNMHNMGHAFKALRQNAIKQWKKVEMLYKEGFRFNFSRWAGPGYRPETMRELQPFLNGTLFKTIREIKG